MMNTFGILKLVATLCAMLMLTPLAEAMTTATPITADLETTAPIMETVVPTTGDEIITVTQVDTTTAGMETTIIQVTTAQVAPNTVARTNPATTALIPNDTVSALTESFSRQGCGTTSLCASEPEACDPAARADCFYFSAQPLTGNSRNFKCQLSGFSSGYISAILSTDPTLGGNDTTYVCANNQDGNVKFIGAQLDNDKLTQATLNVNSVKGRVNSNKIECEFLVTIPVPVTRTTGFTIGLSSGTYDPATNTLGSPVVQFKSPVLDLANPSANVTNTLTTNTTTTNTTTAAPVTSVNPNSTATTSQAVIHHQSLTQALLIIVGVMSLLML